MMRAALKADRRHRAKAPRADVGFSLVERAST